MIFAVSTEPGIVRVSRTREYCGIRMTMADLIRGLAKRGART